MYRLNSMSRLIVHTRRYNNADSTCRERSELIGPDLRPDNKTNICCNCDVVLSCLTYLRELDGRLGMHYAVHTADADTTRPSSWVVLATWMHPSALATQFTTTVANGKAVANFLFRGWPYLSHPLLRLHSLPSIFPHFPSLPSFPCPSLLLPLVFHPPPPLFLHFPFSPSLSFLIYFPPRTIGLNHRYRNLWIMGYLWS